MILICFCLCLFKVRECINEKILMEYLDSLVIFAESFLMHSSQRQKVKVLIWVEWNHGETIAKKKLFCFCLQFSSTRKQKQATPK